MGTFLLATATLLFIVGFSVLARFGYAAYSDRKWREAMRREAEYMDMPAIMPPVGVVGEREYYAYIESNKKYMMRPAARYLN